MEMRRLIGVCAALLYKTGKITHICRYKFHLRKLYHIMRYEREWVVVSCRSLHRILTFAGNPWGQTLQKVRTAPLHGPYRPFHFVMRQPSGIAKIIGTQLEMLHPLCLPFADHGEIVILHRENHAKAHVVRILDALTPRLMPGLLS